MMNYGSGPGFRAKIVEKYQVLFALTEVNCG